MAFQDLAIRVGHEGIAQAKAAIIPFMGKLDRLFSRAVVANSKFNKGLANLKNQTKEAAGEIPGLNRAISLLSNPVALAAASVVALGVGMKKSVDNFKEFEKETASLQGILGATAEEVKFFREQALEMGPDFGRGATEVVEAFKLVGSQRPELLKDQAALAGLTEKVLVLSEASGLDLVASTNSLTGALNQFGESATQADRFMNALAAGAKEGNVDITSLAAGIEASGAVVKTFGGTIEEAVAALEVLGLAELKAAEGGTGLRNVITILADKGFGIAEDGAFDFAKALDEVAAKNLTAAEKSKLFGKENAVAGITLVKNRDRFKELTEAVTGTNLAYEQAAINADTYDGATKRLNSSLKSISVTIGETLTPYLASAAKGLDNFIKTWKKFDFEEADLQLGDTIREAILKRVNPWIRVEKYANRARNEEKRLAEIEAKRNAAIESNQYWAKQADKALGNVEGSAKDATDQIKNLGAAIDALPKMEAPKIEAPTIDFAVPRDSDKRDEAKAQIMEAYEDLFPEEEGLLSFSNLFPDLQETLDQFKEGLNPVEPDDIFKGMEEVGPMLDGVHEQLSKSQLEWLEYRDTIRATMKEAGAEIKDVAIDALGELSMNIGRAIAEGESLSKVFGEAIKDLASQALQILGMGLLKSAFTPQALATFPANLGIAAAGAALLGISAAIPVIGQGGGSASSGAAPSPGPTGGSSSARAGSAPSGLSDFAGDKPAMKVNVNIGGKDFINHVTAEIENEKGRLG